MKIVIRVFNVFIMAISLAAAVLLVATPTISFKARLGMDVETFSEFVPTTEYSNEMKMSDMLGTDKINLGLKFDVYMGDAPKLMGGDKKTINETMLLSNIDNVLDELHEPVELITDYAIRTVIRKTVENEIRTQIENARDAMSSSSTTQDILDDAGMDDQYFANFANALYDAANKKGATVESASNALYEQVDDAMTRAEEFGATNTADFNDKKDEIKNNMVTILSDLNLVNPDGTLKPIGQISFSYIAEHFRGELLAKGYDEAELAQRADEETPDYADRILTTYIMSIIPDAFYTGATTVSIALFIGIFVFIGLWVLLFVLTLLRTLSKKKPWTMFGPWFWIVGSLQLVLGLALTIATNVVLRSINLNIDTGPLKEFLISVRTCCLIPSILFLVSIFIAIPYLVLKIMAKQDYRAELEEEAE